MQVVDESGPGVSATAIAQAPPAREDGADQMPTADGRGADGENESPVSAGVSFGNINIVHA